MLKQAVSIQGNAIAYRKGSYVDVTLIGKEIYTTGQVLYKILVENKEEWIQAESLTKIILPPSTNTRSRVRSLPSCLS